MMKDVYYFGVSILELLLGKSKKDKISISLEALPSSWAKHPESACLIQILAICLNLDIKEDSLSKLKEILTLIGRDYQRYYDDDYDYTKIMKKSTKLSKVKEESNSIA